MLLVTWGASRPESRVCADFVAAAGTHTMTKRTMPRTHMQRGCGQPPRYARLIYALSEYSRHFFRFASKRGYMRQSIHALDWCNW
jgi:hypothetical protein